MEIIFNKYKWPLIIGFIGFVIAILFLTLGFWQTILILLLTALGGVLGFYLHNMGILK